MPERERAPTGFDGYERAVGSPGTRNLLLVLSLIDLANDVVARIADAVPGAVALLTPAGGLTHGAEAALIERLQRHLALNPNVGAVLVVGVAGEQLRNLPQDVTSTGRLADAIGLTEHLDSAAAVAHGTALGREFAAKLAAQPRVRLPLSALRVGLRSSSSSLESARLVNPAVGAVVDALVAAGGSVAFGEAADLAGVAPALIERGSDQASHDALQAAMVEPVRRSRDLGASAPDPTPTNIEGGIDTLEKKGEGALRRLGSGPIHGVFRFGDSMPPTGLRMMAGPGSAAICLTGLAAAGCTLVLYTVGMTSMACASPLSPIIKIGPPLLARSRDVDLVVADSSGSGARELLALVAEIASGRVSASKSMQGRSFMLPAYLPPL